MKKVIAALVVLLAVVAGVSAKKAKKEKAPKAGKSKVETFRFDFSKEFYPGFAYVFENGKSFSSESRIKKMDVLKNEYIIEKATASCGISAIYVTVKVALQTDGSLVYEYSNLKYKDDSLDSSVLKISNPLVSVKNIAKDFDTLLPVVFSDDAAYAKAKAEFFTAPGLLFAMTDGLTEIRAAKFTEIVKDAPMSMDAIVVDAQMNKDEEFGDYQYYISAFAPVGLTAKVYFVYYTNDDDKASAAQGDKMKIAGTAKKFSMNRYNPDKMSFAIVDNAE